MYQYRTERDDKDIAGKKSGTPAERRSPTAPTKNGAAAAAYRNRSVFSGLRHYGSVPQRMESYLYDYLTDSVSSGNSPNSIQSSDQACVQRQLSPTQRRMLKADERLRWIRDHSEKYVNPITNTSLIKTILTNVLGPGLCTQPNIEEVARMLNIAVLAEEREDQAPVDRSQFSQIPNGIDDTELRKILRDPNQGIMIDKLGVKYHHIGGSYSGDGKLIWTLDSDGRIRIWGVYKHGNTNKKYKLNFGTGPDMITLP